MTLKRKGGYHMVAVRPGVYRRIAARARANQRAVYVEANALLEQILGIVQTKESKNGP